MRDLRIRAQNFLSHSDTEINLENCDSVVVIGKNGAGKSSLMIDVPLLVVFGKSREDTDLGDYLRNGKDLMILEYDFSLQNDERFRGVLKVSRKTASGSTSLQFLRIDKHGNQVGEPLTQGGIKETRQLIQKTIGTDFDTLTHTAILEQEEADNLCRAKPLDKMKIVSKIWDLDKYKEMSQIARDIWLGKKDKPGLQAQIAVLETKIASAGQRITEIHKQKEQLETLQTDLEKDAGVILKLEKQKETFQKKLGALDNLQKDLERVKEQHTRAEQDIKMVMDQHAEVLKKVDRFTRILNNQETVRAKVVEESKMIKTIADLEAGTNALDQEIETLRKKIESTRKDFDQKLESAEKVRTEVEASLQKERNKEVDLQKVSAEIGRKETELKHLTEDSGKLTGIACHPDFDPAYVNETCRFIKDAIKAKRRIPELQAEIDTCKAEIESNMVALKASIGVFEEKRTVCLSLLAEIKKSLSQAVLAVDGQVNGKVSDRNKKKSEIDGLKKALDEIRKYTKLLPEIDLAEKEVPGLKEEEKTLATRADALASDSKKYGVDIDRLTDGLAEKPKLESELQMTCNSMNEAVGRKESLTKKVGFIEAEIAQGRILKEQVKQDEVEIEKLSGEKALYQVLEDALKQIPLMIVSRGIGVAENIANEILASSSANGLTVSIKTEKENKNTGKVSDEIFFDFQDSEGPKKYTLLSGGERNVAALALRLAFSEAQAHRRGVRIDSLKADEPFGPLDTEAIELVKEAVKGLKDRFKFMAIITHIEQAKDIFPTHVLLSKGPQGSKVEIQEEWT